MMMNGTVRYKMDFTKLSTYYSINAFWDKGARLLLQKRHVSFYRFLIVSLQDATSPTKYTASLLT
ncbi:hypothetical protein SAMN04488514_10716 [Kriegella aquimaris]|uniref:Uncharacterized protein n=1 Tax=Kriegella aquimaris TaxID=192904 RepID=A0A1G9RX86_9FLAO|nr:hypothetical protein SAMN04488514_10716 [Kriegella aquimaris]